MASYLRTILLVPVGLLLLVLLSFSPLTADAAPTLVGDYRMNATLANAGGALPKLDSIPNGGYGNEIVDGYQCIVWQFAQGGGLKLDPIKKSVLGDEYTIVLLFRLQNVNGYRKLLDFRNGTVDDGLYTYNGFPFFSPYGIGTYSSVGANQYAQVVLTRDLNEMLDLYVDGVMQLSHEDTAENAVMDSNKRLRFFVDDETLGGTEESAGAVARIRFYNGAMTAKQVAGLDREHKDCGGRKTKTIDDDSASVQYGKWDLRKSSKASGGAYKASNPGAIIATFFFDGTSVEYHYLKGPLFSEVNVSIDAVNVDQICQYRNKVKAAAQVYSGLAAGLHSMTINASNGSCGTTGTSSRVGRTDVDPSSSIDKFVVGTKTYEETSHDIYYDGWVQIFSATAWKKGVHTRTGTSAHLFLFFRGTQIQILTDGSGGTFGVKIDEVSKGNVTPSGTAGPQGVMFNNLTDATHLLEISPVSGTTIIDGFRVRK